MNEYTNNNNKSSLCYYFLSRNPLLWPTAWILNYFHVRWSKISQFFTFSCKQSKMYSDENEDKYFCWTTVYQITNAKFFLTDL